LQGIHFQAQLQQHALGNAAALEHQAQQEVTGIYFGLMQALCFQLSQREHPLCFLGKLIHASHGILHLNLPYYPAGLDFGRLKSGGKIRRLQAAGPLPEIVPKRQGAVSRAWDY